MPFSSPEPSFARLCNGRYSVLITSAGTGYSAWEGYALTRWNADWTEDRQGFFIYVRDLASSDLWSVGHQPVQRPAERYQAESAANRFTISRLDKDIETYLEVCVAPHEDVELRRVVLRNHSDQIRCIELTSYIEVVLNYPSADAAHPAFSKLFIQTEFVPEQQTLLARRRPRSPEEASPWMLHALVTESEGVQYETDRARFVGRGYTLAKPLALTTNSPLTGTLGNVLDPILGLRQIVELGAGDSAQFTFLLGAAHNRDTALALINRYPAMEAITQAFEQAPSAEPCQTQAKRLPFEEALQFYNGYGGFSQDGMEYVIHLRPEDPSNLLKWPPLPWINVIANESFGFLLSESGAGYTWSRNSREHRLTPWYNDPIQDPHGEALYIRDEEAGTFWSPMPGPVPQAVPYEVRHGFGYSHYRQVSQGLEQDVLVFVPRQDPIKITWLRLTNRTAVIRRLSLFSYQRLVLGVLPEDSAEHVITGFDEASGAMLAWNPCTGEFANGVTFAAAVMSADTGAIHYTGDRTAFIGRSGSPARPAALCHATALDGRTGADLDPCMALQVPVILPPGAILECAFVFGERESLGQVRALIEGYRLPGAIARAFDEVCHFWRQTVSMVQVKSPSPALDLMVNGWLLYQTLSCRLWGRSAFYQSGGAFGFRDQLQDAAALVYARPELTRAQILLHAAQQFVEGDVLHWWHPPLSRGIRTRFSDDLLWLPYVTAFYVQTTGDRSLLDEQVRFLSARPLAPGEDEAYLLPEDSGGSATIYEHCCRALDRSLTQGPHGLPLMGTGDWNDGMNRVGREGRGESVWLGFFLYHILGEFIPLSEQRGDRERINRYRDYRMGLLTALNQAGWDGGWYRRAYYDDGTPLGSRLSDECRIDALAQAWAVISKAAPPERARQAMDAVEQHLISVEEGLIRLLTPPFDTTPHDPGYIKGYVPGVRENGGQYTHAALWVVQAMAELGRNHRAADLLEMLSPVNHARTPEEVAVYQVEPYVIAADVYGVHPHIGKGGWTWYTGSAGWMYRVALESIFGLKWVNGDRLLLKPCIPDGWPEFQLRYRLPDGATCYDIRVRNPQGKARAVVAATCDGTAVPVENGAACIPLLKDGTVHQVCVMLGEHQGGN